jgi:hypothetical protein
MLNGESFQPKALKIGPNKNGRQRTSMLASAVFSLDKRSPFWFAKIRVRRGVLRLGVPSMCDYSLELVASRPAKVGDQLILAGFPHTISRGFAAVDDPKVAVCLLPGTELAFEDEVRCETGMVFSRRLGHKVARFQQIRRGQPNRHHDALEFPDGKIILLTHLCKGQRATVLQLPASVSVKVQVAERHPSLAVQLVSTKDSVS